MLRWLPLLLALLMAPAQATEAGWALLRNGGQVVLLNHADAPGTGDPAGFEIGNCATQRNLSARGRQQAKRIGALFFARAAPVGQVLTSRYCRTRDTAEFAFGDSVLEDFEPLDQLSPDPEAAAAQIDATLERILGYTGSGNLVMVTHPSNIEALTGVRPRDGEAVILARGEDSVSAAARIAFN
ncbi:histidine phosphatase family protein [Nitratireductor luteus]|uniref:histidine phosphatase family protein n=1 Tax=Nitratireductor luteus TaxID=2976980 RepID=UPI00223F4352|nr:histidine phosphatase family protein [Nitratireductor luteus]